MERTEVFSFKRKANKQTYKSYKDAPQHTAMCKWTDPS